MDYKEYQLSDSLGYLLGNASRLMSCRLGARFREQHYDVTFEQWTLLVQLWNEDGLTQSKLAALTRRDQPGVSRLVDNMIKRDLVIRESHPEDRRKNRIYLTAKGAQLQRKLVVEAMANNADAVGGVSPQELAVFRSVLDRIIDNMQQPKEEV
ncbi:MULTISPECIES: MarR family winged helix-turn-helix transcriptional regulator [Paenibacillus]|uniref:MarR family winged helix-turn-helix transcriptional regulator n=1 Tax=Paenibacillus TaxID=44249 RepID=UPI0022B898ED|nr:MarR family transcriptional regulator [Paenibacillus caseinilyticus]MCZ8518361.1 MarR family transcriptional regulator [Paenibacillus caseinilyticus]